MSSLDRIEELLNRVNELEAQLQGARAQAFKDAAYVADQATKHWDDNPYSEVQQRNYYAYREMAFLLGKWAEDPTRIDGHLAKRERETNEQGTNSRANGEAPASNGDDR